MQALAHPCVVPIALKALVALFPLFGFPAGFMVCTFWIYEKGGKTEGAKPKFPKKSKWTPMGPNILRLGPKPQK